MHVLHIYVYCVLLRVAIEGAVIVHLLYRNYLVL
jgi:hypothetical protein